MSTLTPSQTLSDHPIFSPTCPMDHLMISQYRGKSADTSYGTIGGANSVVQTQVAPVPPVPIPGTVYVAAQTTIQGASTVIKGMDQCGSVNRPGVFTPLPENQNGQPTID